MPLPSHVPGHRDPLTRMRAYALASQILTEAWPDAERLQHHPVTRNIAPQLYAAVGSILANLNDGYSRSSGRDRARFFEYALGSTRESIGWYQSGMPVLGVDVAQQRIDALAEIRRLLLSIIPRERNRLIRPTRQLDPRADSARSPQ